MDKQNRKAIIAGNWKMNKTATEAAELIDALIPAVKDAGCEVVICVPFTDLVTAVAKPRAPTSMLALRTFTLKNPALLPARSALTC